MYPGNTKRKYKVKRKLDMAEIIYLRMRKNIEAKSDQHILLRDISYVSAKEPRKRKLEQMPIYRITSNDRNIVVIDSFLVIDHLTAAIEDIEIQLLGPEQCIISVVSAKKTMNIWLASFVWLLLFVGTAMTIMNFHYDVSMQEVQQRIHYLLTGEESDYPLWIQIPYSFGLGVGTLLFFNHWFNRRFNEEPSPLEVEIFNYQQDLNNYLNYQENELNKTDDKNNSI